MHHAELSDVERIIMVRVRFLPLTFFYIYKIQMAQKFEPLHKLIRHKNLSRHKKMKRHNYLCPIDFVQTDEETMKAVTEMVDVANHETLSPASRDSLKTVSTQVSVILTPAILTRLTFSVKLTLDSLESC